MGQQKQRNRRWVLASRPHGAPVAENFRLEEDDVATHYLYEAINPAELQDRIESYHELLAALKVKDKERCRHCLAEIMQQNVAMLYQQYNR